MNEFYKKLVEYKGVETQIIKSIEEMAELTQVLCFTSTKLEQYTDKQLREKVIEEMAHVLMTFESLKVIFKIDNESIKKEIKLKEKLITFEKEVQKSVDNYKK